MIQTPSNRIVIGVLLGALALSACGRQVAAAPHERHVIDVTGGTPINQMIRGYSYNVALPTKCPEWHSLYKIEEILYRTSARGPSEGGSSQTYDWRTRVDRQGGGGKTTLYFLRMMRDRDCEAIITVNMSPGNVETGGAKAIEQMARDWVYYMNHTLVTYRQSDEIPSGRDTDILDSLRWGDYDTLLKPGEKPLYRVKYYEIGNETGGKTPGPGLVDRLVNRYKEISRAVLSEDPDAKVGPCAYESSNAYFEALAADPDAQIDFACYHPYGVMANTKWGCYPDTPDGDPEPTENYLCNMVNRHAARHQSMVDALRNALRSIGTPLAITEWSPGPWGGTSWEWATMAHALATCESIFIWMSYQKGPIFAANFFSEGGWLRSPTETPKFYLHEALQEHLGDYLIDWYNPGDASQIRMYTTRNHDNDKIVIWGLNLSDDTSRFMHITLENMPFAHGNVTLMRLGQKDGRDTRLLDYIPEHTPDDQTPIIWTSTDMTGLNLADFSLTFEGATISALVIEK